ncbi:ParA family protein [Rehaibacterium terrae]|jgi:chromosome partitioning protein|uniref:Chromosome partitioning protein n=1 Tax=Rehaibacterium terrae TaxID=1341696 RepID=A0A7W7Y1X1_9GAMM|nr:ParA family protein [Rehaibacterium terrae]MBB5016616.1 chromosome partitioning protein [Rehaibacterium terrae]
MRIWAVANQKGGVGKTTTTLALGSLLAQRGRRVLMIDLDPHASLSRTLGTPADPPPRGTLELFDEPPAGLAELRRPAGREGLDFVAAHAGLATLEKRSATRPGLGLALSRAIEAARGQYDHVLLDCPPTLGVLMVNALAAADLAIVPTQTEPLALFGLEGMCRTAAMIERSRQRALPVGILPTLHDRRTRVAHDTLLELRERHGRRVFDDVIPVDTRLRDTAYVLAANPAGGRGLIAYDAALLWLLALDRPLESAA